MPQTGTDRRIPAILAAACLIGASICVSAAYVIPAVMHRQGNYASSDVEDAVFSHDLRYATWLLVIAGVLGVIAVVLAVYAIVRNRPAM